MRTDPTHAPPPTQVSPPSTSRRRWGLVTLNLATFMLLLDITIIQVALPSIQRHLGGGLTGLQWTIDAYALPLSALVVTLGTIADRWGRRRMFAFGIAAFTGASLACGLAPSLGALDIARALQGIGGAAMFATTLALIGQEFPGPARARAITLWGSVVGLAVASGPLVGGLLTQFAGWRWIFLVNVPVGVATLALTFRFIGEGRDPFGRRLDVPGLVTLTAGLTLVTAGLLRGGAAGWHGWFGWGAIAAGAVSLVAFAGLQVRPGAMIDVTLLRTPAFAGVSAATLALGAGMFAMILFFNLYLQNVLGYALQGGLRLLPITAPVFLVPLVARRLGVPVVSGRVIGSGLMLCAAGLLAMLPAGATTSWTRMVVGMLLAGLGIGLANPAIAATGLAVVPGERSGLAAGVSNTSRLAGLTLGIAVLGALFHAAVSSTLGAAPPQAGSLIAAGEVARGAALLGGSNALALSQHAFTAGLHRILVAGASITFLGSAVAFLLVRSPGGLTRRLAQPPAPEARPVPAAR